MNFSTLKDQIRILCSADFMAADKGRILEAVRRAQIRYEYWDLIEQAQYGDAETIKRKLAAKYNISVSTVHKYVYPKF